LGSPSSVLGFYSEASLLSELKYPQIRLSPQSLFARIGRFVACRTKRWGQ
jgi:hypothetical protein